MSNETQAITFSCGHSMTLPADSILEMPSAVKAGPCLNCAISNAVTEEAKRPPLTPKEKQAKLLKLSTTLRDAQTSMRKLFLIQKLRPYLEPLVEATTQSLISVREQAIEELLLLLPAKESDLKTQDNEPTIAGLRLVKAKLHDAVAQLIGANDPSAPEGAQSIDDVYDLAARARANANAALSTVESMLAILDVEGAK